MIRVVVDTNVLVSALLQPLGQPARVFMHALNSSIQMCVSNDVYREYEEVIRRPRLRRDEETIVETLRLIRERGFWVQPTRAVRACSDPDDDIMLECANAAEARYVVTGNLKDFPVTWEGVLVVTCRQLLAVLEEGG